MGGEVTDFFLLQCYCCFFFDRFRQQVPDVVPELEIKATHGLVKPEDFDLPLPSELWSPSAYESFDITKAAPDYSVKKNNRCDVTQTLVIPALES